MNQNKTKNYLEAGNGCMKYMCSKWYNTTTCYGTTTYSVSWICVMHEYRTSGTSKKEHFLE